MIYLALPVGWAFDDQFECCTLQLVDHQLRESAEPKGSHCGRVAREFCCAASPAKQRAAQILNLHPRLVGQGGRRSAADPFVIAFAMVNNRAVVTDEHATGNMNRPHIPDVCGDLGVSCLNLMEYIEAQGWTY
jgi:hypothetical protein